MKCSFVQAGHGTDSCALCGSVDAGSSASQCGTFMPVCDARRSLQPYLGYLMPVTLREFIKQTPIAITAAFAAIGSSAAAAMPSITIDDIALRCIDKCEQISATLHIVNKGAATEAAIQYCELLGPQGLEVNARIASKMLGRSQAIAPIKLPEHGEASAVIQFEKNEKSFGILVRTMKVRCLDASGADIVSPSIILVRTYPASIKLRPENDIEMWGPIR
jgi:hypothetical protein